MAQFSIVSGVKTNRVRERRARGVVYQSKTGVLADNSVRGQPYTVIAVSVPLAILERIDDAAEARQMSRSAFMRFAALALADGKLKP